MAIAMETTPIDAHGPSWFMEDEPTTQTTTHIERLEITEPPCSVDIHAGTFTYTTPEGQQVTAEFYVRTCDKDETDAQRQSKRQDDLNEQFTDMWSKLINDRDAN